MIGRIYRSWCIVCMPWIHILRAERYSFSAIYWFTFPDDSSFFVWQSFWIFKNSVFFGWAGSFQIIRCLVSSKINILLLSFQPFLCFVILQRVFFLWIKGSIFLLDMIVWMNWLWTFNVSTKVTMSQHTYIF